MLQGLYVHSQILDCGTLYIITTIIMAFVLELAH